MKNKQDWNNVIGMLIDCLAPFIAAAVFFGIMMLKDLL